jgi:predicted metalloprotease
MRWQGRRESDNVEDRRDEDDGGGAGGFGMPFPGAGGGGFQLPIPTSGGGLIGLLVIIGLALLFGVDPRVLLGGGEGQLPGGVNQIQLPRDHSPSAVSAQDDDLKRFVSVVLADTEDVWGQIFRDMGRTYARPRLVLYRGGIQSGCGYGAAQMGPFYCPNDQKVYIDLSFYQELKNRFHAPGEFAQAYVIAHEVGHHVQNLLGIMRQAQTQQAALSETGRNAVQVKIELQADCFAGVWAKNTDRINKSLEPGDIEQALTAASAIGDDALQKQTRGFAVPDSFTHGSSAQRVRWFRQGYDGGTIASCDTFSTPSL